MSRTRPALHRSRRDSTTGRLRTRLLCLALLASAAACGSDGDPSGPDDGSPAATRLVVDAPTSATEGTDFTVTVAARTAGGQLASDFSGSATLSVDGGTVTPASVDLVNGTISADVRISGLAGAVTLAARSGALEGSTILEILAPTDRLIGAPGDPAVAAIPAVEYGSQEEDFSIGHPDLPGLPMTVDVVLVALAANSRVGAANELLADLGAKIVGGAPGIADETPGILALRVPTTSHAEMEILLGTVRESPLVVVALQDIRLDHDRVTLSNGGQPADWDWKSFDSGGNWGMKRVRAPHLWNLNPGIRKAIADGSSRASGTLILDSEFLPSHPDAAYVNLNPAQIGAHGTQVAGVVGATHDNQSGVDGLNPFAVITGVAKSSTGGLVMDYVAQVGANPTTRVVNMSLGYNWYLLQPPVNPDTDPAAQAQASRAGRLFAVSQRIVAARRALPVVVTSAGNSGPRNARFNSPQANAALEHGEANVLVVEALDPGRDASGGEIRAAYSGVNGHLSAPGTAIRTTGDSAQPAGYATVSGTSLAAPHVAGLIGYLYTLDPSLADPTAASNPVGDVLVRTAAPVAGAAPRIDAFAVALEATAQRTLALLTDIDDGTPDGNLRLDQPGGAPFLDDDADGDGGPGDGRVDMSDFRRWRDGYLFLQRPLTNQLDGAVDHPKKDLNASGVVDFAEEFYFPFVDLNGDNETDATTAAYLPGVFDDDVTDLEVLQHLFDDPHYDASDLPTLLESADIAIRPDRVAASGVVTIRTSVTAPGAQTPWQERTHTGSASSGDGMHQVYTVPVGSPGETWTVRLVGLDGDGQVVQDIDGSFSVDLGVDHFWDPEPEVLTTGPLVWTFDDDLDGWIAEERPRDGFPWGTVGWNSREGGVAVFDAVGWDGEPNSWLEISVELPDDVSTMRYRSSAHDRGPGAASIRVRLEPAGGAITTVSDWEELSTGPDGFDFVDKQFDISAWAGQTVKLYIEHGNPDEGGNNQRWLTEVEIR